MDVSSVGDFGHHLHMATFSSQVFLHQAEVDIGEKTTRAYFVE